LAVETEEVASGVETEAEGLAEATEEAASGVAIVAVVLVSPTEEVDALEVAVVEVAVEGPRAPSMLSKSTDTLGSSSLEELRRICW